MANEKLTRDEQREAARAKAKAIREQQKRGETRRKAIWISAISLVSVAAIVWVVAIVTGASPSPVQGLKVPAVAVSNGGFALGSDLKPVSDVSKIDTNIPKIILYEDPQCPICKGFEAPNMPVIQDLVKSGKYSLELHPISFLDGNSPNEYSSRAASAIACVAQYSPDNFMDFHTAMFQQQPQENTLGPDNNALAKLATTNGVTSSQATACIKNGDYAEWAKKLGTDIWTGKVAESNLKFGGTPFVLVNGQQYRGDLSQPAAFVQWLQTVAPVPAS